MLLAASIFEYLPFLFPLLFLVIAFAVFRANQRAEAKRSEALRQFAMENGLSFEPEANLALWEVPGMQFFRGKFAVKVRNILSGRAAGTDARFAEVAFGSGKHRVQQSVASFDAGTDLPMFHLKPTGWADRFAEKFGMKDIDFEGHPEFSQRYTLTAPDEATARAFFTPLMIAAAESLPPGSAYNVAGAGRWLVVYVPARRATPEQLRTFLDESSQVAQAFLRAAGRSSFGS